MARKKEHEEPPLEASVISVPVTEAAEAEIVRLTRLFAGGIPDQFVDQWVDKHFPSASLRAAASAFGRERESTLRG